MKAGSYRVFVQDAMGCTVVTSPIVLVQPTKVSATLASNTVVTCNGGSNGAITISNPVGLSPFKYKIGITGTFTTFSAPTTISNLKAGTYAIYIQDANGCESSGIAGTIAQIAKVSANVTKVDESCPSVKNGSITATGTGGSPAYQYKLNLTGTYSSNNYFTGLGAAVYKVYVIDSKGCLGVSAPITINVTTDPCPPPINTKTSIAKNKLNNAESVRISLTPNPSSNLFTLVCHSNKSLPVLVKVVDVNGKSVYEAKGQPEQLFIFGEKLANGLYLIKVTQGDEVKTIKAVKGR